MRAFRQFLGYSVGIVALTVAIGLAINIVSLEVARYMPAQATDQSGEAGLAADTAFVSRADGANPVWIAPTPRYQYDPKLMEVRPPHELRQEAERRRKQEQAKYRTQQRDAKHRSKPAMQAAREAFASVGSREPPPAFLMFSPH